MFSGLITGNGRSRRFENLQFTPRALLATDEFSCENPAEVILCFYENYIKTGKVEQKFGKWLLDAEQAKAKYEGDDFYEIDKSFAEELSNNAAYYADMILSLLKKRPELAQHFDDEWDMTMELTNMSDEKIKLLEDCQMLSEILEGCAPYEMPDSLFEEVVNLA